MYFITKNDGNRTEIVGAASNKEAAQGKLQKTAHAYFMDAIGSGDDKPLALTRSDCFGGFDFNGHFVIFRISELLDEELIAPVLGALAENFEKYGLTETQKSQVENLLKIFKEENKQGD